MYAADPEPLDVVGVVIDMKERIDLNNGERYSEFDTDSKYGHHPKADGGFERISCFPTRTMFVLGSCA